jgi:hypothetical protein
VERLLHLRRLRHATLLRPGSSPRSSALSRLLPRIAGGTEAPEEGAALSGRPSPAELLERPGTLLSRTDLRELGLPRRAVDACFRALPTIHLPGYARPLIRAEDFRAWLD